MSGSGSGTPITPIAVDTVAVDIWIDEVAPAAPFCPTKILRKDILNACREFCRETQLWTQTLNPISLTAGTAEYALAATGADIAGGDRATILGRAKPLNAVSDTALDRDGDEYSDWRTRTQNPVAIDRWYITSEYKARLVYIPDAALTNGLNIVLYVMPLETATTVPAFLYNEYKDVIALGAKGKLKLRDNMPWTDYQTGAGLMDLFQQGIFKGQQKKHTGFQKVRTRDIVRTRYHDF